MSADCTPALARSVGGSRQALSPPFVAGRDRFPVHFLHIDALARCAAIAQLAQLLEAASCGVLPAKRSMTEECRKT